MIYASIITYLLFYMGHISLVPQFYLIGSGSVLPVLPTILMSAPTNYRFLLYTVWTFIISVRNKASIYIKRYVSEWVTFCLSPGGQTICLSPGGQTFFTHRWGGDKHFWHTGGDKHFMLKMLVVMMMSMGRRRMWAKRTLLWAKRASSPQELEFLGARRALKF